MARPFFVVVSPSWMDRPDNRKHLERGRVALGAVDLSLADHSQLFVRLRDDTTHEITTDEGGSFVALVGNEVFLNSDSLVHNITQAKGRDDYLVLYFEATRTLSRCIVEWWSEGTFSAVDGDGTLRLGAYDLPPATSAVVDSQQIVRALRNHAADIDSELFAMQATRFLEGPHVLERLFDHLMELRAIKAPNFITITKVISDQLRDDLNKDRSPIRIRSVKHSHMELWASVEGSPISFVDGGVARLAGFPGIEQFAMRVGTYRVVPGDTDPSSREQWGMLSVVLADMVDMASTGGDQPDRKRLQEAIRYLLEAIALLHELERTDPPSIAFLHGPLINQFATYDELEPYFLPDLLPEFLGQFGLSEAVVTSEVDTLPHQNDGSVHWNQWIPLYALTIRRIFEAHTPAVGVVERSVGNQVTFSLLDTLVSRGVIKDAQSTKTKGLIREYGISDDLLFGCVLEQGQYISPPLTLPKNPTNRAHGRWLPVVKQYRSPRATILKPHDGTFPIRLEVNQAAAEQVDHVASVAYHTSRLLPRYAFPVGLDIVDKYAKVPDWMSKAVSTAGAAALLKKALDHDDDPIFVAQVRRVLAGQPRDFFFRPKVQ